MSILNTRLLVTVAVCLCCSRALVAADSKAPHGNLTAAQIVERYIAARGGLQAWHAVHAMAWNGKVDAGRGDSSNRSARYLQTTTAPMSKRKMAAAVAAGGDKADAGKTEAENQVQLPFSLAMERPRKSRLELEFAGKTAVQVYDGSNGWKVRPFLNRNEVEPFTADEARAEAAASDLDGPLLDAAAHGTKVDLEGMEPVEGHDAYKLKLTAKSGNVQHIWIDAQSFLDVKLEGTPRRMDGRMRTVWIYQRDFRSVQGLMIPFVLETAVDGYRATHKMQIDKVTVNPKLDDAAFAKPRV